MIVIGMGSGRSGTKSLARLLNEQNNAEVTHEFGEPLHWDTNPLHWGLFEDRLEKWSKEPMAKYDEDTNELNLAMQGDVASWYLPYMERLARQAINDKDILDSHPIRDGLNKVLQPFDLKVIILKRDKDEVIESFDEWTGQGNRWQKQGGDWPEYDCAFPTYSDELNKQEAIGQYWTDYYETCEWLQDLYPENVRIFDIDVLNSEEGQRKIFDFLGFEGEVILPLKENSREAIKNG